MSDSFIRFLIGGLVVSLFSSLGDVLRPKSFAGLFGAAPSIALATIGLTIEQNGKTYAAVECLDDAGRDRLLRIRLERQLGFKTLQA
jgi:hypothetical protein